jgi:N-acetylmuramoyl-L-alanine amidase
MVNIVEMLLTNHNRPKKKLIKLKGLVIHWTANANVGSDADNNRNYFNTTKTSASAHYIIDDKQIVKCLPDDEVGYHVGANKYTKVGMTLTQGTLEPDNSPFYSPNYFTCGIEMCVNQDGDWNKIYQNTVEFSAKFLKEHELTIDNLYRHYDITGKDCPKMMIDETEWKKFKTAVNNILNPIPKPIDKKYKYSKVSTTHVVEIEPLALKIATPDIAANKINLSNFVTSGYQVQQANGHAYPLGILVSEGKVIQNRQPHNLSAGTLIIYKDGKVECKPVLDIKKETNVNNVWFAVSGCSISPTIRMNEEGFKGKFSDIGRTVLRPVIGYNPTTNKIIIAVRPDSDITRGQLTLKNLGCTMGITLDAGGSTVLKVDGQMLVSTTRQLYSVITW